MILKGAHIQNFKGISSWELEFQPGFNLIKGVNGTGKTSVLEALAVGLGGFVAGINGVATRHFSQEEIRKVYRRERHSVSMRVLPSKKGFPLQKKKTRLKTKMPE